MATMKYELLLLDYNTGYVPWPGKMDIILAHMGLNDALLCIKKMSSSLSIEEIYALYVTKGIDSRIKLFVNHHFICETAVPRGGIGYTHDNPDDMMIKVLPFC